MSDIHFFQRYSQRENVVTNNTLRLFTQIYRDSPSRLQNLLEGLVDGTSVDVGVNMQQQTSAPKSVPDGALTQPSFKVVIETKLGDNFSADQLERHLNAFEDEEQRILLLLSSREPDAASLSEVEDAFEELDEAISFAAVQFSDVIDLLIGDNGLVSEYEKELRALVEDYRNFCSEEGLLPDDDLMRAVPCGTSHEDNFEYDLYYHPASRGYRHHQYIGIYFDKSIRGIGKLEKTVEVDVVDGKLEGEDVERLSEGEKERILGAIQAASKHGYSIGQGYEFFLVDQFYRTDFTKASKYGMQGAQYFSLRDHVEANEATDLPKTETLAEELREAAWK
jgi:hypothetical protein